VNCTRTHGVKIKLVHL